MIFYVMVCRLFSSDFLNVSLGVLLGLMAFGGFLGFLFLLKWPVILISFACLGFLSFMFFGAFVHVFPFSPRGYGFSRFHYLGQEV